jgi:hypothetical protein
MLNTATWKKDPANRDQGLCAEWVKLFADDKGQFTLYEPGLRQMHRTGYRGRVGFTSC